jgi:Inhibitor of growth proteins N-terminal histone-binding
MSTALGRRQSSRAVRSTAGRPQNYYSVQFSQTAEDPVPPDRQPGFFPAITHFTDSLDALPREVMRHFSMMKEVEAKLHAPDEELTKLAAQIATIPRPSTSNDLITTNSSNGQTATSDQSSIASASKDGREVDPAYLLRQLNFRIATMAPMLDEKIAVLSTASMTLSRQIEVMESSYKHVPEEVSPEARLGSTTHWAYVAEKEPKKTGTERTRREAAAANSYAGGISRAHDLDEASGRSEARREALMARKIRNQQLDSDFEERPASRKQHAKSRKQAEQNQTSGGAVTIMNGASGPNKRKKPIGGAPPIERSINAALAGPKNQIGSPTLGAEVGKKRKNAPGPLPGRKR